MWYLDTGASNHMTGDEDKFQNLDRKIQGVVKFGNESKVRIKGKGSILLQCKNGEERKLEDVYYIPDLCSNIISLGSSLKDVMRSESKSLSYGCMMIHEDY